MELTKGMLEDLVEEAFYCGFWFSRVLTQKEVGECNFWLKFMFEERLKRLEKLLGMRPHFLCKALKKVEEVPSSGGSISEVDIFGEM